MGPIDWQPVIASPWSVMISYNYIIYKAIIVQYNKQFRSVAGWE